MIAVALLHGSDPGHGMLLPEEIAPEAGFVIQTYAAEEIGFVHVIVHNPNAGHYTKQSVAYEQLARFLANWLNFFATEYGVDCETQNFAKEDFQILTGDNDNVR